MTANTATITDITWDMMSHAGLDTDTITRQDNGLDGGYEYIALSADGTLKAAFGPSVDMSGDDGTEDLGWDVCLYSLTNDGECWETAGQSHSFDTDTVLAAVRGWVGGYTTYAVVASCRYRDEVRRYDIAATSPEDAAAEAAERYGHESTIGVDTADVTVVHGGIVR